MTMPSERDARSSAYIASAACTACCCGSPASMASLPRTGAGRYYAVDEVDQAAEVRRLVVVHRHVAAFRAEQITAAGQLVGQACHVLRVHGVVARADDQRGHGDLS